MTQTEALRMALEALDCIYSPLHVREINKVGAAMAAITEALAQPEQEPALSGLPMVLAGAIFDFAGYLTTRDKVIKVGSTANAAPIADLVKEWADLRGLSLDDPAVLSWQETIKPGYVPASDTSQDRVDETAKQRHEQEPVAWAGVDFDIKTSPPKREWQGLTADELNMIGDSMRTWNSHSLTDVYVAIEAKLKEKNT